MDNRNFDEEHNMFREAFRAFLEKEVIPNREQWIEDGIVSREIWRKAGEQGYLMPWADEQYGGLGIKDFRYSQIPIEELLGIGETSFHMSLHSSLISPYIANFGNEEQKQRFLPPCITGEKILAIAMTEPGMGSDLAGMKSTAVDCGDHYLLNGNKTFISNGILADLVIVAAKTDPEHPRAMGLFVVERGMEGFERGRNLKKMGMKGQDTAELFFSDVKVPKENLLGQADKGMHYLMQGLAEERLIAACCSLASAKYAFDITLEYIQDRKAFGQTIGSFQNTRFKMADMITEIDMTQVYIDHCVTLLNQGKMSSADGAKVKLYASELQGRVTDECLQLFGGYGYMDEYPISRLYTDARIARIFGGTSEIMKEIISKSLGLK